MSEPNYLIKYYDSVPSDWDRRKTVAFYHEMQFRKFMEHLGEGDRVLDVGCASGVHAPLFLGIGRRLSYTGIDISNRMIKVAKSFYPQLNFVNGNAIDHKPPQQYSAFWAPAVIMHLTEADQQLLYYNLELIVKKNGFGYISMPSARPNQTSLLDERPFYVSYPAAYIELLAKRGWRLLEWGAIEVNGQSSLWNWFLFQLPDNKIQTSRHD